jgi:hypothetical protein
MIALSDEISSTPKLEVRERCTEAEHEVAHVLAAPARCMQRILEQHVRGSEFVDDLRVPRVALETLEPAAHQGLVFLFA